MSSYQEQPSPEAIPAAPRPSSAGSMLAARRSEAGLTLDYVAAQLKLAKRQIEALEEERFDALPGNTFVRGFVRNYARLLEIDAQPLLQDLARRLPAEPTQAALPRLKDDAMPLMRPGAGGTVTFAKFLGLGVVLALLAAASWLYLNNRHTPILTFGSLAVSRPLPRAEQVETAGPNAAPATSVAAETASTTPFSAPIPTTPPELSPSASAARKPDATMAQQRPAVAYGAPAATAVESAATGPSAGSAAIRIVAQEDSWVQVVDTHGNVLLSALLKAGESRDVGGAPPYAVRIGNASHTRLYYQGKPVDLSTHMKVNVANVVLK